MKRKIFEKQIIDLDTGEITSISSITVSKFNETFVLGRTTDGLEWLRELSGNEVKLLMFLTEMEDLKTKLVHLTTNQREYLLECMKIGKVMLRRLIVQLEQKGLLVRLNNNEICLNPKCFYKGPSKEVVGRIIKFETFISSKKR
jgi:hypothetical protein